MGWGGGGGKGGGGGGGGGGEGILLLHFFEKILFPLSFSIFSVGRPRKVY